MAERLIPTGELVRIEISGQLEHVDEAVEHLKNNWKLKPASTVGWEVCGHVADGDPVKAELLMRISPEPDIFAAQVPVVGHTVDGSRKSTVS